MEVQNPKIDKINKEVVIPPDLLPPMLKRQIGTYYSEELSMLVEDNSPFLDLSHDLLETNNHLIIQAPTPFNHTLEFSEVGLIGNSSEA